MSREGEETGIFHRLAKNKEEQPISDAAVRNLKRRYPMVDDSLIREALRKTKGHAGRAVVYVRCAYARDRTASKSNHPATTNALSEQMVDHSEEQQKVRCSLCKHAQDPQETSRPFRQARRGCGEITAGVATSRTAAATTTPTITTAAAATAAAKAATVAIAAAPAAKGTAAKA